MRVPIRSERDAFRFTYGFVAAVGLAVLLGYLIHPLAGVALFALFAMGALIWDLRTGEAKSALLEAEQAGRQQGVPGGHRILVVASEALGDETFGREISRRGAQSTRIEVLAPVLQSKSHFMTTDIDRETQAARRRLEQTLRWARQHGLVASGHVGDPIDPLTSLEDELRRYDVDEVIVATHPIPQANWVETQILERLREQLNIPVTHVVVGETQHAAPRANPA